MNNRAWLCSTHEEYWNCPREFVTREEAIAYAITTLADEHGLEEGRRVFTGEVRHMTADDLLGKLDERRILFAVDDLLRTALGQDFDYELVATEHQHKALAQQLILTARKWFVDHKLTGKAWVIQHVRSHVWLTQAGIRIPRDQ